MLSYSSVLWKEEDETYKVDKVVVLGKEYALHRLREFICEAVKKVDKKLLYDFVSRLGRLGWKIRGGKVSVDDNYSGIIDALILDNQIMFWEKKRPDTIERIVKFLIDCKVSEVNPFLRGVK